MTATDELRKLLDERGVEHYDGWSGEIRYTKWQGNYSMWFLAHDSFGTDGELLYVQGINMTPAQAVEATLGADGMEWDGDVLVLTLLRDPSSIHVQRAEGQPRKVYPAEATLGRETCKLPETRIDHGSIEYNGTTEWRKCSECGEEVLAYPARFCPNCGRKVVSDG